MPIRIATIGRNGQVARALAACAADDDGITLVQAASNEADLRAADSLSRFLDAAQPDVLVNTGAYNFVDRAETEREAAFAINAHGPRTLARLTRDRGIAFIHMSTDCVFDGTKTGPYAESDPPNPLSVYGRSKFAGEQAVAEENPTASITRVCWVFSEHGENFVSRIIALARSQPLLRVVDDQRGPPTYGPDIARALIALARRKRDRTPGHAGLLHLAAPAVIDRATMARAILDASRAHGGPYAPVEPVPTASFSAPAQRPLNAQLSGAHATALLGLSWTSWPEALDRSVRGVLARS